MQALNKLIIKLLRETANKIEAGTCELHVEDKGEPPAYTIGYLVMRMYEVYRKWLV